MNSCQVSSTQVCLPSASFSLTFCGGIPQCITECPAFWVTWSKLGGSAPSSLDYSGVGCCNHPGVTCNVASQITALNFSFNALNGFLPSFTNLSILNSLDLQGNQLSSIIPSNIGSLSSLVWLDLRNNKMTGTLPSSISTLTKLEYLSLAGNLFSGSIPDVFSTTRIKSL